MAKIVNSWNEWDPLKRMIVGRPEGTNIPAPVQGYQLEQHQLKLTLANNTNPFEQRIRKLNSMFGNEFSGYIFPACITFYYLFFCGENIVGSTFYLRFKIMTETAFIAGIIL